LTCKNRLPYYLYCVGGDVKHYTIQSAVRASYTFIGSFARYKFVTYCQCAVFVFVTDPLLVSLAHDVFTVLAKNERCIVALQQRLLPTLLSVLQATSDKLPFGMQSVSADLCSLKTVRHQLVNWHSSTGSFTLWICHVKHFDFLPCSLTLLVIIIIIIKQENDYSDVRRLIAVARALYKIKLKTHMLIVQ